MTLHSLRKEIQKYNKVINRYQHRMTLLTKQQNTYIIVRDRLMSQLAEKSKVEVPGTEIQTGTVDEA